MENRRLSRIFHLHNMAASRVLLRSEGILRDEAVAVIRQAKQESLLNAIKSTSMVRYLLTLTLLVYSRVIS
jgi:hypothetical protein